MINSKDIQFIFAEFGSRQKANQNFVDSNRLDPTYYSIKKYFPNASIFVYTDDAKKFNIYKNIEVVEIKQSNNPFDMNNPRWGWHCCDYYQALGLINSKSKINISVDNDLYFLNSHVTQLPEIIEKYGICILQNPRQLVKVDGKLERGNDGNWEYEKEPILGNLLTYDLWWMGLSSNCVSGRIFLEKFLQLMIENPLRGPLQLSRASWSTGLIPYCMPKQWAVGEMDINCKDEIILHIGHESVLEYYKNLISKDVFKFVNKKENFKQ